jgi:hypothetical protein
MDAAIPDSARVILFAREGKRIGIAWTKTRRGNESVCLRTVVASHRARVRATRWLLAVTKERPGSLPTESEIHPARFRHTLATCVNPELSQHETVQTMRKPHCLLKHATICIA